MVRGDIRGTVHLFRALASESQCWSEAEKSCLASVLVTLVLSLLVQGTPGRPFLLTPLLPLLLSFLPGLGCVTWHFYSGVSHLAAAGTFIRNTALCRDCCVSLLLSSGVLVGTVLGIATGDLRCLVIHLT